jgi:two-component system, chemotaxis family, protein-glutamate methylesterase/glutaminase
LGQQVIQQKIIAAEPPVIGSERVNIMVVDDSAIVRGFISRWLESEPSLRVAATAASGDAALAMLKVSDIDVVILDIEMPGMDGIAALPKILEMAPHVQIIMASTLTQRNAEISMRALELGAADYVPKPRTSLSADAGLSFRNELVAKAQSLGARARKLRGPGTPQARKVPLMPALAPVQAPAEAAPSLRPLSAITPKIIAIGSSTGGPQALFTLLSGLVRPFPVPIVITQHMPATFTAILAQHIERITGFPAVEARHDMPIEAGKVYVAPGDHHLEFNNYPALRAVITQDPPVNFCRPAVDPMFASLAKIYANEVLAIILTGMGKDGTDGSRHIAAAGGNILSQDEDSSVVWGMPRAVAKAGLSSFIGPIEQISATVNRLLGRYVA